MRVLVIGAGIGGLGAATALAQRGTDVHLVEIKPDFSVPGVGINQPANSLRAMRAIGVLDECLAAGFQFDHSEIYGADGTRTARSQYPLGTDDVPANNALSRGALQSILVSAAGRAGVKIDLGVTVDRFTDTGECVEVALTDGRHDRYDLVVAFDGIGSPTRRALFGERFEPVYTGFGVLRVTLPRPADLIGMRVYQSLGVKAGFCPLSESSMYIFVVTAQPADVVLDPTSFGETLRAQLAPFGGLPAEVRESITGPGGIVFSPIADVLLPLPWFVGRVGVLGDAAHACAPHLTQGAAMALEDGVVLAEMLTAETAPLDDVLRRFGARRYPRVKLVQDVSRQILLDEMAITEETYEAAMRASAAGQPRPSPAVEQLFNVPA